MGLIFKREDASGIKLRIADDSSRGAYRVVPDRDDPVLLQVEGGLVRLLDISATGFSCLADSLTEGMRYRIKLNLPDYPEEIEAFADVVTIDESSVARCRFFDLNELQQDWLHRYVLIRQKRAIKATRVHEYD